MHIGLYFGSFNPIHNGHLIITNLVREKAGLDKVWLVVSPQNPLKDKKLLADEHQRFEMTKLGIGENPFIQASNIEFGLPKPSYTIQTLYFLKEKFSNYTFSIIIGEDNLVNFSEWKDHKKILENYLIYVYQRNVINKAYQRINHPNIHMLDLPLLNISSTDIRGRIAAGRSVQYMIPDNVISFINIHGIYK